MRHNKIIGWNTFLNVVERVQRISPWASRQLTKRAAEWPFWYSGLSVEEWTDRHVRVAMPHTLRTSLDGEVSQGHLVLGAELGVRLLLLRYREEFPFRYRIVATTVESHHVVNQGLDYRFAIELAEWESIRLTLARDGRHEAEFRVQAYLADGRAAATFTFRAAFALEKYLSA